MGQKLLRVLAICALVGGAVAPITGAGATGNPVDPQASSPARQAWDDAVRSAPNHRAATTSAPGTPVPAAVGANPAITVTPATDLVRGQVVKVTGTDLGTQDVVIIECPAGVTPAYSCDLSSFTTTTPDASGAISADFTVHRIVNGSAGRVDCSAATDACDLVVADVNATVLARHALTFDPNATAPQSAITVTPATGLVAGQMVSVSGTGFAPNDFIQIGECAVSDLGCTDGTSFAGADDTGAFTISFPVRLRVNDGAGSYTHCLAVDCLLRAVSSRDSEYLADAPITFDPNQPLPPVPTITVTPSTGLHHQQAVTVAGTGFDPNGFAQVSECSSNTGAFCGEYLTGAQTAADGTFSTTVVVTRLISDFGPTGPTVVDCANTACSISATGFGSSNFELVARAPIGFDASVPPPALPVVTVTPTENLPYRAQVAIHGTGFSPGESVYAEYCVESPTDGDCANYADGTADGTGTIDISLTVKRRAFPNGVDPVDCLDPTVECSVQVQGQHAYEQTRTALTFDPNAPIPPSPTAAVTPDQNLGYRQAVAVTGTGFVPGIVDVEQCGTVADLGSPFQFCAGFAQLSADQGGTLTGDIEVRRMLSFGSPGAPSVDCATAPTPCTLRIGSGDPDESARVPLGFDPNSQPPPPPAVSLTPATHERDGQTVTVTGARFTGGALVGLAPCKAGVTAIADACDISRASVATADATGAFSVTRTAVGVIQTAEGPFDCTAIANSCVIAAANAADLSEFAFAPMSFDVPDVELHSTTVTEGTGMMTTADVMVELSAPIGSPTTVEWLAFPGTAGPDDYLEGRGRVTIPAGATEAMIHVHIVGDAINEPTERFLVAISSAPGTHITDGTATVKIRDDDAEPTLGVGDAQVHEGDGTASVGVMLTAASGRDITVEFRTHHDSARSGSDFVRSRGSVTIPAGALGAVIRIPIVDDAVHERTETFRVELDDAEHAALDGRHDTATVTILDND